MFIADKIKQRSAARGLSLVELLMFLVIVSIALIGILQVLSLTTKMSGDPQVRKQALSIAEALLEEVELAHFTYCDPTDATAATAANTAGCTTTIENVGPELGNSRPYDNVNDYVPSFAPTVQSYLNDVNGNPFFPSAGIFTVNLSITPENLNGIVSTAAPATMDVLRIVVTVTYHGGADAVVLEGYRTRYAPNALP